MDNWDEIRTAYQVARMGTVSGAAEVLGVHHATVIRHIDALEAALGAKLFQRHARGYTATEAGRTCCRSRGSPTISSRSWPAGSRGAAMR
jgi:DNA-binding transcriptional LysR family regulator